MNFEYVVAYENITDKFDNGHCRIKVKVTVGIWNVSPFTTIQTIMFGTTLVESRKLILSKYFYPTKIHNMYEYHHA